MLLAAAILQRPATRLNKALVVSRRILQIILFLHRLEIIYLCRNAVAYFQIRSELWLL